MTTKHFCDVCGEQIGGRIEKQLNVLSVNGFNYDICQSCSSKLAIETLVKKAYNTIFIDKKIEMIKMVFPYPRKL